MRQFLAFILLFSLTQTALAQVAQEQQPDDKPTVKLGTHCEFSEDSLFNYNLYYTSIEVAGFKVQYDVFSYPASYQRIWILPHKFTVTESEDFVLAISPGFSVSNSLNGQPNDWLVGADVDYSFPKQRIQIFQRSYKGNHFDQHYVLSAWQPLKDQGQLLIVHFINISDQYPSTSYVGPAANLWDGTVFFWTGVSLTNNATWASNLQLTIEF